MTASWGLTVLLMVASWFWGVHRGRVNAERSANFRATGKRR